MLRRKDDRFEGPGGLPPISTACFSADWLRRQTRKKTLDMIRVLIRHERRRDVRKFLASFLVNGDFYTYYERAGSHELAARVKAARDGLLAMKDRPLSPACPSQRRGRKRLA